MMIHLTNNDNVVLITKRSRRSKATNEIRSSGAASRGMTKGSEHHHHHGRVGKAKTAGKERMHIGHFHNVIIREEDWRAQSS